MPDPKSQTNDPQRRLEQSRHGIEEPWYVLGAGSIGCLFGAHLQLAGHPVRFILRDAASLAQLQNNGGVVLHHGASQQTVVIAADAANQLGAVSIRKILVCTKAHQTRDALAAIQPAIDPAALIVLLQNGMGVREQLAALLPHATTLNALSTEGAYQTTRFHVVHAGRGETVIGARTAAQQSIALSTATALQCGLRIAAVPDIDQRLWRKLAVNSVINPLSALHDCSNGEVLNLPDIDNLLHALCTEVSAVANADGQVLAVGELVENVRQVCIATARNRSSMLQDIAARRRTEIDFINGYVLRQAAAHGIECPHQADLYARVKALELRLGCG